MARLAEAHGLFGVMTGAGDPRTAITAAVYASTATDFTRVIVRVLLGQEQPVTIAEELAVLDNVNNGRTVILADTGESAQRYMASGAHGVVYRNVTSPSLVDCVRKVARGESPRWKVPAGLPANVTAPKAIAVTPKPAQLEIPFWLTGGAAGEVAKPSHLAVLARDAKAASVERSVQPAIAAITGTLEEDRETVIAWAAAGATHLLLELPEGAQHEAALAMISRYLAPEVAMPNFPRVMSTSKVPLAWPGDGRG